MDRFIEVGNKKIFYLLKKSKRAKKIKIVVDFDGKVMVVLPRMVPEWIATRFIKSKKEWLLKKVTFAKSIPKLEKKGYFESKEEALKLVNKKINYFNQFYNFSYNNVFVKNQKTRWGSCSSKKNLNFNYRIIFLPPKLQDYIIVHELCHLREMNHSLNFWNQVAKVIPEYAKLRKELNKKSLSLA